MYNIDTVVDEIMVTTLMNLGSKYKDENKHTLSEKSYNEAYERMVKLANVNPRKHKPLLIDALTALAELHEAEGTYDLAIAKYREIVSLSRILLRETASLKYVTLLAHTATKVANLHREHHNRQLAQYFYTEALEHYSVLEKEEDYTLTQVAILNISFSLIGLYEEDNLFANAKIYYRKSLDICQNLIERGVNEYNYELGKLHCDLASVYFFEADFEKAKKHYHASLELLLEFEEENSEMYIESLAIVQNNLASIYAAQKKYDKALSFYKSALPHLSSLAETNPTKYGHNVAVLFKNLASIYFYDGKIEKAEFFHFKSIKIFEEFSEYNAQKYNLELASCIIDGVEYYEQHTLTLYNAENILHQYEWDSEAEMLLGRISKLRKAKVRERV
jgi:tetratricopeptide (TPR) repeat protein